MSDDQETRVIALDIISIMRDIAEDEKQKLEAVKEVIENTEGLADSARTTLLMDYASHVGAMKTLDRLFNSLHEAAATQAGVPASSFDVETPGEMEDDVKEAYQNSKVTKH